MEQKPGIDAEITHGDMFRDLIESVSHVVFTLDDNGHFTYLSPQCEDILGIPAEELAGKPITSVITPADKDRLCAKYREVKTGNSYPSDYRVFDRDGKIHHVRCKISRSHIRKDGKTEVVGIISEIANWQTAEEALRVSEEKVKKILGYSKDGIILTDETGTLIEWNPAMEQITGTRRSEAVGKTIWDMSYALIPPEEKNEQSRNRLMEEYRSFLDPGRSVWHDRSLESGIACPDATRRTLESVEFRIPTEKGAVIAAITRDITDRKKSETALQQANRKLKLLSGITRHDVRNKLMALQAYLDLMKQYAGNPAKLAEYIGKAEEIAGTIDHQIAFTREYECIGVSAPAWHDCRALADAAVHQVPPERIRVINDLPAGALVYADPLIVKVFYNLIENAVRHGGKITSVRIFLRECGDTIHILCEDDGVGIPAEEKEVIFDRGFGKNTGLGLFLAREILAITDIAIRETGEQGIGARFEILIPKGKYRREAV